MPNTPCLVGQGMSALCWTPGVTSNEQKMILHLMSSVGKVLAVSEDQMDVVTAVSGSGPAYIYYLAECLMAAGHEEGLDQADAALLVKQTILGAAQMMCEPKANPAILREKSNVSWRNNGCRIERYDGSRSA